MTEPSPLRLLFVCTGNICRSPMAEGIARHYGLVRGWPVQARSGGILGIIDKPADPLAVKVMAEIDMDISGHRSGGIDDALVDWADHILVMELGHSMRLRERHPGAADKTLMLGNFGGMMEVQDPIGGWRWKFRGCRDGLLRCVQGFMDQLPPPQSPIQAP
jgi:protein-tyrosine-phosphatase